MTILARNNYSVDAVYDGETALQYLGADNYDGVIFGHHDAKGGRDYGVEADTGKGNLIPVLLLTAKSEVDDKVLGLDAAPTIT